MIPAHLELLMCPRTKGPLRIATDDEVAAANAEIASGESGREPLEAGLFCDSGGLQLLYPVRDGIPVLLATEAIELVMPGRSNQTNESSK